MESSKLEIIILAILAKQPCHAYKIEKIIEEKKLREGIDIGFSTIYSTLRKFNDKDLLRYKKVNQDDSPSKKVYHLTDQGEKYLKKNLKNLLTEPEIKFSDFDIALHFSDSLSDSELKNTLQTYEQNLNDRIKDIIKQLTQVSEDDRHKKDILNRTLYILRAEKQWLKELLL